jgi:two-component system sensor histidine kinase LytS
MSPPIWVDMLERVSVLMTFAFALSHTETFRRMVSREVKLRDWWILTFVFGFIGIVGSYAGIPVDGALANSRAVGVMAAGLIGGPAMGFSSALIAGAHRYMIGGFTGLSGAIANLCEGLMAGFVSWLYPKKTVPWWVALISGAIGELMQMGIILLTARPFEQAVFLVKDFGVAMISVNAIGLAIFMLIIKSAQDAQDRAGSEKAHKVLDIATRTLPYLRRGLNSYSAKKTAEIIYDIGGYDAVAVTDTKKILAFVGAEAAHHISGGGGLTKATCQVLATGMHIAQNSKEIGCPYSGCRLTSAVIVPLKQAERVIGALKLYYVRSNMIGPTDIVFAEGVAHLFSTQLELTEIDRQTKLTSKAELKALHAQINPHFLFNALNTITSLVRTEPDVARGLLVKLGTLFRMTMHKTGKNITIAEELEHVRTYLSIEQARHGEKLLVQEEIEEGALSYLIPYLTIQPLVENAIKHGLQPQEDGGHITLKVAELEQGIEIRIIDDGVGMDLTAHHPLEKPSGQSIGLMNVHERLRGQYGRGLELVSEPGQGSTIIICLPKHKQDEGEEDA